MKEIMDGLEEILAWAFFRRSTDMQDASLEFQDTGCMAGAAKLGAKIIRKFIPHKTYASGLTIYRDPVFLEMVRLAETTKHGVKYLFVLNTSRFGRLPPEQMIYWDQRFLMAGIRVIYVEEDFKNDGSLGDGISKYIAHSEAHKSSVDKGVSTLKGNLVHAAKGISLGGAAPYGLARLLVDEGGRPVQILPHGQRKATKTQHVRWVKGDPLEVATIIRIFTMFDRGIGQWTIVDTLNQEGIPSPRGRKWLKGCVRYILMNEAYIGIKVYNKRDYSVWRKLRKVRVKPRAEWVEAQVEPIIERALFDRVQARFKTRSIGNGKPYRTNYLLSSKLHCTCGYRYTGIPKYHDGKRTPAYTCNGYHSAGRSVCGGLCFTAAQVEDFVLAEIGEKLKLVSTREKLRQFVAEALNGRTAENPALTVAALKSRMAEIEAGIGNVVAAIKRGLALDPLDAELKSLMADKARVDKLLEEELRKPAARFDVDQVADTIMARVGDWRETLAKGNPEERKDFVAGFVNRGLIDPKKGEAVFEFYKLPFAQKEITERAALGDFLPVKNVAGAGFEPATSRL